ncbi:Putative phytanoyl-CoA dioxygenase (Phytanic acid oxidase) (Phytanoyl-CoA alpha-hydroxylase) (PhyH) [Durusdinium trenchii]|uniref:Phytanoyl-CoA dioxygenase (Phytanic acid oxidase) (Phytanoyl-CoA alpha-hydroxylase) (PhyH) n=1 Tax=Durusdinium trenchii TaxID=1381693 RepID=A0ABP0I9D5_9DINO
MQQDQVASFNFCMQKPLKTHQKTAGCWGMAFAILHFANLALLLHEQNHGLHLTDEEEDIYEHGFQSHGVTPRQFAKLLKAGAKFQNYAPGERIVAAGDAVQRVLYVTEGTCVAERAAGVVNIEYHQDVFIGTLWPKAWRSEFLGIPFTNEPNTNEDWEDSWLIEQAEARGLRNRGTSDDLHALLRSGLEEKTGPLTNVRAGSAWVSDVVAGPEGCRLLEWPLGVFSCAVGADESLCTAFQHVETMGLASKIVKGASRKALEGYKEILRATLSDNMIRPEETPCDANLVNGMSLVTDRGAVGQKYMKIMKVEDGFDDGRSKLHDLYATMHVHEVNTLCRRLLDIALAAKDFVVAMGVVVTQDIEGSAPASDRPSIRRSETGSESQSDLYNAALEEVQKACDVSERQRCGQRLAVIAKALRAAKRKPLEKTQRTEWSAYPEPVTLPRCPDDARYVKSFSTEVADLPAAQHFFHEYGFVVFRDVLTAPECEATVAEIWRSLEERTPGLERHDSESWSLLSSERYGLPEEQAVFTPQIVANRQNDRVYAALDAVLPRMSGIEDFDSPHPDPNSVVVTQDRWCIYRPAGDDASARTAENLHLDVNPWTYAGLKPTEIEDLRYGMTIAGDHRFPLQDFRAELTAVQGRGSSTGEHVQGVLNLLDNLEEDGGTRVVPGFHRCFMPWLRALGDMESNLAQSGQHDNWVLRRAAGGGSFKFSNLDRIHQLSRRIPMRAGSFLLWNQLLVHGSCANNSANFRIAQFITGFRAGEMSPGRSWARAAAVQRHNSGLLLRPLAPHVFGEARGTEGTEGTAGPADGRSFARSEREHLAVEQVLQTSKGHPEAILKAGWGV